MIALLLLLVRDDMQGLDRLGFLHKYLNVFPSSKTLIFAHVTWSTRGTTLAQSTPMLKANITFQPTVICTSCNLCYLAIIITSNFYEFYCHESGT